ncbi:MAG: hypothetical protein FRX48_08307 [Lasallia pustulata]|uniref:Single-stranded nucleic acid binding R3H n=1 Tax=Lasallia pustulata TaxID=136370 RepID=A0A5M8PGB4_9LECA|nr:MAG: hypothetical protein FRX48_08307 [Lasallia pustulata]
MATHAPPNRATRPSFASIAAMAPSAQQERSMGAPGINGPRSGGGGPSTHTLSTTPTQGLLEVQLNRELEGPMSRLGIKEPSPVFNNLSRAEVGPEQRPGHNVDDEQTQMSASSTKPASLDGKSVASGTTFALDEKESLRPDDSASVKAAEEEDSYSGPASGAPSSRVGSEAGGRAFRDQFQEISQRIGPGMPRGSLANGKGFPGIVEEGPQGPLQPLAPTVQVPPIVPGREPVHISGGPFGLTRQDPDEKLLEALESPKDRLFLLRLEQDVITFVRDSKEPILDLPPCNSFCRLLAHKLADYYALTHFVDNAVSSVRLYRTPYCRLPTPLSIISNPPTAAGTPPSAQPAVKIMQRAGLGKDVQKQRSGENTNPSSMIQSKAGSEAGDDGIVSPVDSTMAKDKSTMTREEREAMYKEARERIFKGFEDPDLPEGPPLGDLSNEVSRASSTTGKKKTKKHKNNDDGFEARSQFIQSNPYYPALQYTGTAYDQAAVAAAYFNPYGPQQINQVGPPGNSSMPMMPQPYGQAYQQMPNMSNPTMAMPQMGMSNGFTTYGPSVGPPTIPGYGQQMPQIPMHYYQPLQQPATMGQQSSAMSSPALSSSAQLARPQSQMSDQQWSQSPYQSSFLMPTNQHRPYQAQVQNVAAPISMPTVPYQYGQLPFQPTMQSGRPPHPLPGSYNRQSFNPQTRSFVPGNSFNQPQTGSYGQVTNDSNMGNPNMNYFGGNRPTPYGQQPNPYLQAPSAPVPTSYNYPQNDRNYQARKTSSQTTPSQPPVQNSLSKWGTPAHLPPKPPPSEVPVMPESHHTLPVNVHTGLNPQAMNNSQGLAHTQNGTYASSGTGT